MENTTEKKKVILSGIQPTGVFTLGNYLGAVVNWEKLQQDYNCAYMIADMHAITVRQEPQKLRKQILESYALLLACGIDPKKSLAFMQSHVKTHAELSWVLSCNTQFGELSRMTQFKDKSAKHSDNINAGLFTYPVLMAADILLYQPDLVPTGVDQKQHIELARNIAVRFNNMYGNTFKMPEPYMPKTGAKVMSLQDPTKKMSKSDENVNATVSILDDPDVIIKKFKRAVTDSVGVVAFDEERPGISNLMTIYSAVTGLSYEQIQKDFEGKGYGDFKMAVGAQVADTLAPIREKFSELMKAPDYLKECYQSGAELATKISQRTLDKVYKKVGFVPFK